jgi:DNA (cytosine-5)-methyltransferase 1
MASYFLSLFAGIGGFDLGAYWANLRFDGHYFSEIDQYAAGVFQKRFPEAVALGDVRSIEYDKLPKGEWIITGGFPCQDISVAGKGAGLDGDRSGLWFEYARLIGEIRPRFAIMENVGALTFRGLDRVLGSLAEIGYDAEWQDIRACDVGAPHRRERIWIVCYPCGGGCGGIARRRTGAESSHGHLQLETRNPDRNTDGINEREKQEICGGENAKPCGICTDVADTGCEGIHESGIAEATGRSYGESGRVYEYGVPGGEEEKRKNIPDTDSQRCQELIDRITTWAGDADSPSCRNGIGNFWAVEPNVGRVANGVSSRVDRLKGLGNSVVPQIPELIFMCPAFDRWRRKE